MSLPVNFMQGSDSREPNHWRNLTLEPVPGERLFVDPTPTGPHRSMRASDSYPEEKSKVLHWSSETVWLVKGLRASARQDFGCEAIFSHRKGFFLPPVLPSSGGRGGHLAAHVRSLLWSTVYLGSTNCTRCWCYDNLTPSLLRNTGCRISCMQLSG
ncbi:hypothetical protein V8C42DRAFT_90804 [Trichoderma barbatum]